MREVEVVHVVDREVPEAPRLAIGLQADPSELVVGARVEVAVGGEPLSQHVAVNARMRAPAAGLGEGGAHHRQLGVPVGAVGQVRMRAALVRCAERLKALGAEERPRPGHRHGREELAHARLVDVIGVEAEADHARLRSTKPTRCPMCSRSGKTRAMSRATRLSSWS